MQRPDGPYNPHWSNAAPGQGPPPRIRFSALEVQHLAGAVLLLSLAFAIVLNFDAFEKGDPFVDRFRIPPEILVGSVLAVLTGFVLHELAHKVLAQHYGHWAEFRAQFAGLLLSLGLAAAAGLLFAAPGAVMIRGAVTPRENGLISLVGPGTNFAIAALAVPFTYGVADLDSGVPAVLYTVAFVNVLLCLFNLLPFGPFDGRKVWNWNKAAWVGAVLAGVGLAILTFKGTRPPF